MLSAFSDQFCKEIWKNNQIKFYVVFYTNRVNQRYMGN